MIGVPWIKLCIAAAVLAAAWWVWDSDRERHAEAAVEAALKPIREEGAKVKSERDQLAKDKQAIAAQAVVDFNEREGARKDRDEEKRLRAVAERNLVDRLRASRVDPGSRRIDPEPVNTCGTDHRQLDDRIDQLLERGQGLALSGADLVATGGELVDRGERGLGRAASLIDLANAWGKAVRLGERP
jgi:hypothetical protein